MPTSENPAESSSAGHEDRSDTERFMLTLCRLTGPIRIRPSAAPQLRRFTLFTSRARHADGSERLYLHMGYFETLRQAQRWLEVLRGRFPDAIATLAPPAFRRNAGEDPLSDSQVLRILGSRRAPGLANDSPAEEGRVALLSPEDTATRRALKEAVDQGAPVSFAVQLQWSAQPIDPGRLASRPVFKAHTLYATESRRGGTSRYFLRLGFFADPMSARQVAAEVHSEFPAAAVVPVSDQELASASAATRETSVTPILVHERAEPASDFHRAPNPAHERNPAREPRSDAASRISETLEQTLEQLAARESWNDPDSLSDSGVRHLRVEIQKRTRPTWPWSGRSR